MQRSHTAYTYMLDTFHDLTANNVTVAPGIGVGPEAAIATHVRSTT